MWGISPHLFIYEVLRMPKPKIFIAIPTQGSMRTELARTLNIWISSDKYDLSIYTNDDHPLDKARNICVSEFMKTNCEYMFWIDSDMNCSLDTLDKLLIHDKDMVSAICLWWKYVQETGQHALIPMAVKGEAVISGRGCTEVDRSNVNCTLIKREVLEKLGPGKFYYDFTNQERTELNSSEDYTFCDAVNAAGYQIFVDFDIITSHYKTVDILDIFKYLSNALEVRKC